MLTLTTILTLSIAFFIENKFFSPFSGFILPKFGVMGFVVNIKPNCITFAIMPATATQIQTGKIIKSALPKVFTTIIFTVGKVSG